MKTIICDKCQKPINSLRDLGYGVRIEYLIAKGFTDIALGRKMTIELCDSCRKEFEKWVLPDKD